MNARSGFVFKTLLVAACLSGALVLFSYLRLGSPWALYSLVVGQTLYVSPQNQTAFIGSGARVVKVPVAVTNVSFGMTKFM
jgi:hypothetical protein